MRMSKYIDGELEQELCAELKKHLKGCDRCRIVFDTTKKTITFYRDSTPYPLPSQVHKRLHQALRSRWKEKHRRVVRAT